MSERRVAIVTGAGTGLGRATAQVLLENGIDCALTGRRSEPLAIRGPACFSDVSELCPNAIR